MSSMDRHECLMVVADLTSGAAVSDWDVGPPVGEAWRIIAARANHDDPAAHDMQLLIYQGASYFAAYYYVAVPQFVEHMLYGSTVSAFSESVILKYGDTLRQHYPVVLAAGKKAYWQLVYERILGVCT